MNINYKQEIKYIRDHLLSDPTQCGFNRDVITLMVKAANDKVDKSLSFCEWSENGDYWDLGCGKSIVVDPYYTPKFCGSCSKEISYI